MKIIRLSFIGFFLISISIASCQTPNDSTLLVKQGGYTLTTKHFEKHIADIEVAIGELSKEEIQSEKRLLIEMFKEAPEEILASLEEKDSISPTPSPAPDSIPKPNPSPSNLPVGHQKLRDVLNGDIGQMKFESQAANQFRVFMANSLLTAGSSSGDIDIGRGSETKVQFCADGTYSEYRSAYLVGEVPGMDFGGTDEDNIPGYWEVASLPNGMMIILLYSTHPLMLEDSSNGLLPFYVGQYGQDFVALPNGDGYRRTISNCN